MHDLAEPLEHSWTVPARAVDASPSAPIEHPIKIAGGIFLKVTSFPVAGTVCPQHAHSYAHMSWIASGGVRIEADGLVLGEFFAPEGVEIKSGVRHMFTTLLPDTMVACVHSVDRFEAHEDGEVAHAV